MGFDTCDHANMLVAPIRVEDTLHPSLHPYSISLRQSQNLILDKLCVFVCMCLDGMLREEAKTVQC